MNFGNYGKYKKILKNEKEIKKIHDGVQMKCSNEECFNKVTLKPEEAERNIMCTKCNKGFFVKIEKQKKMKQDKKSVKK